MRFYTFFARNTRNMGTMTFFPSNVTRQLLEEISQAVGKQQFDQARALSKKIAPAEKNNKYVKGCLAGIEQEERVKRYTEKLREEMKKIMAP